VNDASGATAIEYALIGGIVSLIIVGGATAIGANLLGKFDTVATSLR
jgi:pilus assembly protein Flp/PilA